MDKERATKLREEMVEQQIAARGVCNSAVLEAMRTVPREEFVPPALQSLAYTDQPLPIEENQTISQPYIVASMAEALELKPEDIVLEVGAGSGYAAAVLSRIVKHVYAIEYFSHLKELAEQRFKALGYTNITIRQGDGSLGWPEHAPFQGITVAAGGPYIPQPLKQQLAIGGRLIMPIDRDAFSQELIRAIKRGDDDFNYENLGAVRFVPLLGDRGQSLD